MQTSVFKLTYWKKGVLSVFFFLDQNQAFCLHVQVNRIVSQKSTAQMLGYFCIVY